LNKYFTLLIKHETKIKILLVIYTLFCSYKIGLSWDENFYHQTGSINLKYLLSFGQIDEPFPSKYRYSTLYWSALSFINQMFPQKFSMEVYHILNSFFGLMTIVGLYKLNKILFNKNIAKISAIFLFFIPFFYGHFAINFKDIILAFAYVWIIYYIYKYVFFENNFKKKLFLIFKISLLSALGTGVQLLFLGSLIPIILLFLIVILFYKKKNFKILLIDFFLFLFLFYFILILFWVDTHSDIIRLPLEFFNKTLSLNVGWTLNLLNGEYLNANDIPYNYLLISYLYKLPEFLIILYLLSIPVLFFNREIIKKKIKNFKIIIIIIFFLLIYPSLVLVLIPYPVYDGLRLFLWSAPCLVIIPSITTYIIFINKNFYYNFTKVILSLLFIFHIFNFLTITPYHYTFLNYFSGEKEFRYKKFENDYWSTSLKELILSSKLDDDNVTFYSCGVSPGIAKKYMKQQYKRSEFTNKNEASYIIMTNRTLISEKNNKITNCYDEYQLENIHKVMRNGIVLSAIKKNKND
tara:strand:+ start:102 stop:1664 length:1563 start_codon:yes stop_codon:yes gene_type:complete